MKPEQFIREFGVEKAREVVEGAPTRAEWVTLSGTYLKTNDSESDELAMWCESELHWFCRCMDKDSPEFKESIRISTLKRLVESCDMIVRFAYDIEGAKQLLEFADGCGGIEFKTRTISVERFKQAIKDHESIYGGTYES